MTTKTDDRTRNSVLRQIATLQTMDMDQLHEKWRDLYGGEPPKYQKSFLTKRLAHRIQELFYGGLSDEAKNRLAQIAKSDPIATVKRKIPTERKTTDDMLPGTLLVRIWHDQRYEVTAKENGFEYDNRTFTSLSAIAREITGTRWNGRAFFGVKKSSNGGKK